MRNKEKGITLIALVITIIVLLILAGVTLNLTIGENGIFTVAKRAAMEQKKQTYFEEIKLEIFEEQTKRVMEPTTELFIVSIEKRIKTKAWVKDVLMCDERGIEKEPEASTMLIVETIEGYEIRIKVDNEEETAEIIEEYFEKVGKKITVRYDGNGGTGAVASQEVKEGFSVLTSLNKYTKENYIFSGWCEDINGNSTIYAENSKFTPTKDTILYAIWDKNVVTVTFYKNNELATEVTEEQMISRNAETTLTSNTFECTGYTFEKWNTCKDGTGTDYFDRQKVILNNDISLYAIWNEITYTITYNLNGGSLETGNENPPTYTINTPTISLNNPSKYNYVFTGWTGSNGTTENTDVSITKGSSGNKTYTANWEIQPPQVIPLGSTTPVTLTTSNIATYLGKKVNYIDSSNSGKNYRLFYVDFNNKYLDGVGTIYLKADYETSDTTLSPYAEYTTTSDEVFRKMNQQWADADGEIDNVNEHCALWLADPTQWTSYSNDEANYAIGSPSVEMYIDSYNTKYGTNFKSKCDNVGYWYCVKQENGNDVWQWNSDNNILQLNSMYTHSLSGTYYWWLSSPCANLALETEVGNCVSLINVNALRLGGPMANRTYGTCPLVSLNTKTIRLAE